jgi:hypothetical protein
MTDCVYVFSNPSMPGVVKIGMTRNGEEGVEKRRKDLSSATSSPTPFVCEGFVSTRNAKALEVKAHTALREKRVSKNREFFAVPPKKAVGLLKQLQAQELPNTPPKEEFRVDFCGLTFYKKVLINLDVGLAGPVVSMLSVIFNLFLQDIYKKRLPGDVPKLWLEVARNAPPEAVLIVLALSPFVCALGEAINSGCLRNDEKGWFFQGTQEEWKWVEEKVYNRLP